MKNQNATNKIPFNKISVTDEEFNLMRDAIARGQISGDGHYTELCHEWLKSHLHCHGTLLTHSCTAAIEMASLLANIEPGDEVIMPSFTFVSTANPFVLRGAKIVFTDIRPDTLNIDETKIEDAITAKTKAIVPVHYAGVSCEMNKINEIAAKHNLVVIEDAAQGLMASYYGKPLGTMGSLGTLSFHDTKNVIAGEGGALIINDPKLYTRAEIIRQKGTNRKQFLRGEVDKYTWVDMGSSFLPSEIIAALLYGQLKRAEEITKNRLSIWQRYHQCLQPLAKQGYLTQPTIPHGCEHNGHIYYILLPSAELRNELMAYLKSQGVSSVFHYIPLHSAPAGIKFGRAHKKLTNTDTLAHRQLRLPMWYGLNEVDQICEKIEKFLK